VERGAGSREQRAMGMEQGAKGAGYKTCNPGTLNTCGTIAEQL
jgi:hypothetical protein